MKFGKTILQSALVGVFALAANVSFAEGEEATEAAAPAAAAPAGKEEAKMEKCFGVAKKGANDCGTASHGCAGKSVKDNDEKDFKNVKEGACTAMQAKMKKPAGAKKK
jgi:uncharacterized membrane protein